MNLLKIAGESALVTFLVVVLPMLTPRIVGYFMALDKKRRNSKNENRK